MTEARRILIIEDDLLMMRVFERQFKLKGLDVQIFSSGEEAISKIESLEYTPVAILLDLMLPKVSGFDVLKAYRAIEKLKDVPIFILTNLAGAGDSEKALSMGATDYFIKSEHDPEDIADQVFKVLPH